MEVGNRVQHKFHKWNGVVEVVLEPNIVFVRWMSGIGLIYSTDLLVIVKDDDK